MISLGFTAPSLLRHHNRVAAASNIGQACSRPGASDMAYENIIVETRGRVGLIRLNRPQALNALNRALMGELGQAIAAFEADTNIGCMVITGSERLSPPVPTSKKWPTRISPSVLRRFLRRLASGGGGTQAGGRRGGGFCARRRLQTGHAMRSHHRRRQRKFGQPETSSASFPASAAPSGSPTRSARPRPWTSSSPAG